MNIILIALLTVFASCAGTVAGFGTSAIMIGILVMFFPFSSVLLLVGIIHWFGSASKTVLFRKGIDLKFVLPFALPAMVGSFLGAYFVLLAPDRILSQLLGVFLIVYVLFSHFKPNIEIPKWPSLIAVGGTLSGLSAGLLGIAGSIRTAFFSAHHLSKRSFLAAAGIGGIAIDSTRLVTYYFQGTTISREFLWGLLLFIPAAFLGTMIGKKTVLHFSEKRFRAVIAFFLFVVGIRLIFFPV